MTKWRAHVVAYIRLNT